ncbi:MAG: hypothetical protein EXR49_07575 [Dehalococcoidia bacterium]|nr:hypothetical protein [Dehalococcoidia bacterium]
MKTKMMGVPKAFDKYTQDEVDLILSLVPTSENVKILAGSLGRTEGAIQVLYEYAYSGTWLKKDFERMEAHQDNVLTKIANTKRKRGITIGYRPRKISSSKQSVQQ